MTDKTGTEFLYKRKVSLKKTMPTKFIYKKRSSVLLWARLADDIFPENYEDSTWAVWVKRIKEGQSNEKEILKSRIKKWGKKLNRVDDRYAEDFWRIDHVTNSMFGALIVSIWSQLEHFLKGMVEVCHEKECKRENKRSYRFDEIKKCLEKVLSIDLEKWRSYKMINAIRILNNSFKHKNSYYKPEQKKSYEHISPTLLQRWDIKNKKEIDFSKIIIEDLISACAIFHEKLVRAIKEKLRNDNMD